MRISVRPIAIFQLIPLPLIRPLAWAKLKLRFGVAWSGTFSLWEKGKDSPALRPRSLCGRRRIAHSLSIDVDDEGDQQDEPADQDLEETVDVDVVEAVVEHA